MVAIGKDYYALLDQINKFRRLDSAVRVGLTTLTAEMKTRIFEQGKASNGKRIGTYSAAYKKLKKKKGKPSNFVNLKFTDQMFFDFGLQVLGKGEYGIGFNNQFNYNKSIWNEERYGKEIFNETKKESELVDKVIQKFLDSIN